LIDLGSNDVGSDNVSGVPVQLLVHGVVKGGVWDIWRDGRSVHDILGISEVQDDIFRWVSRQEGVLETVIFEGYFITSGVDWSIVEIWLDVVGNGWICVQVSEGIVQLELGESLIIGVLLGNRKWVNWVDYSLGEVRLGWDDCEGNWFINLYSVQKDMDEVLDGGGLGGSEVHHISSISVSLTDDNGDILVTWISSLYIGNLWVVIILVKSDILDVSQFNLNYLRDSCD